jgi:K+ transporter
VLLKRRYHKSDTAYFISVKSTIILTTILLECKERKYWREKLIHDKWLNMNKEITYTKMLKTTNRTHIQNTGTYLDIFKNKWFSKIKDT